MINEQETNELLCLQKRTLEEREMIGWLCTIHRHAVIYENNPGATKKIQEQLNHASNLISLTYIWALLDEQGFNENNKWILSADRLELKAWKHVRHTGAHAPGGRAKIYFKEFDQFMDSPEPGSSGLQKNCTFTPTSIELGDGMNYEFFQFVQVVIQKALAYCANNNQPV